MCLVGCRDGHHILNCWRVSWQLPVVVCNMCNIVVVFCSKHMLLRCIFTHISSHTFPHTSHAMLRLVHLRRVACFPHVSSLSSVVDAPPRCAACCMRCVAHATCVHSIPHSEGEQHVKPPKPSSQQHAPSSTPQQVASSNEQATEDAEDHQAASVPISADQADPDEVMDEVVGKATTSSA